MNHLPHAMDGTVFLYHIYTVLKLIGFCCKLHMVNMENGW